MPETRQRKKVTERLYSKMDASPFTMPGFPPTSSKAGVGGMREIQLLGHTNYRPTFCNMNTRTLPDGYGLQTHPTGNGLLLLTQTGYKLDTWITCPIANVSDQKNKN